MSVQRIRRVLVANRGEIARRVMRTCRDMGISTVAVFSDADQGAPFVGEADEAVRIGPAPSVESYLCIERIIEAARRTGADALHPGYGFLAENAGLAEACAAAGVVFIGPPAAVIRSMGDKRQARAIARDAGLPVLPGYEGDAQDAVTLAARAREVGLPVMLKASAGGGGKGMRVVREEGALRPAIESARREAEGAFGDGTLLVERYVEAPRHVEVQILGDAHGHLVHLFERECSIQRRHQKVVEESPAPALTSAQREAICGGAVALGRSIGYQSAGTVELLLGQDGAYYFLEVNTRLQVEHAVTEAVTGLDLVREQIRVARGEPLGYGQEDLHSEGAAIEVRVYAEDPAKGFLPASGRVVDWHIPPMQGLRVETGVEAGCEVSIHYDPMLAKLIAYGEDRSQALGRMSRALRSLSVAGPRTNRALLLDVIEHPEFIAGRFDTGFIEEHLRDTLSAPPSEEALHDAAVAAALAGQEARRRAAPGPRIRTGYRNNRFRDQRVSFDGPTGELRVEYRDQGGGRFDLRVGEAACSVTVQGWDGPVLTLEQEGHRRRLRVVSDGAAHHVHGPRGHVVLFERPRFPERGGEDVSGGCRAPMPGRITELKVAPGDPVDEGQVLLVMEAMKMEHSLRSPRAGEVAELRVAAGEQVEADQVLVVLSS